MISSITVEIRLKNSSIVSKNDKNIETVIYLKEIIFMNEDEYMKEKLP